MDLEKLGAVLRQRRMQLGIPASEVARRVGVSPNYIWMIETAYPRGYRGPSRVSEDRLRNWADALSLDEPYARQLLRLAGYIDDSVASFTAWPDEDEEDVSDRVAMAPAMAWNPPPRELAEGVLFESVSELLDESEAAGMLDETHRLLADYITFLRHRVSLRSPAHET